jgi:hypothetical protein
MAAARDPEAEAPQEAQRLERLRVLDLSAVGLAFPIALMLGYFGGRAIGGWLGSAQLGGLIGALVGIVGGFYNLFKMVSRLAPRRTAASATGSAGAAGAAGSTGVGGAAIGAAAAAAAGRPPVAGSAGEPAGPEDLLDDAEADLDLFDDDPADLDPLDDDPADPPEDP